jgi:hypothetical protein
MKNSECEELILLFLKMWVCIVEDDGIGNVTPKAREIIMVAEEILNNEHTVSRPV